MMIGLDQIDVSTIVEIKFVLKSDENPENIQYFMTIKQWTPRDLKI